MIFGWLALLALHSGICLVLMVLLLLDTGSGAYAWLPETRSLILWTVAAFGTGPFLGIFVWVCGPRRPSPGGTSPAVGRRLRRLSGLLLLFPVALFGGIAVGKGSAFEIAVNTAIGAAGLLTLLAPWIALYGRWFNEA